MTTSSSLRGCTHNDRVASRAEWPALFTRPTYPPPLCLPRHPSVSTHTSIPTFRFHSNAKPRIMPRSTVAKEYVGDIGCQPKKQASPSSIDCFTNKSSTIPRAKMLVFINTSTCIHSYFSPGPSVTVSYISISTPTILCTRKHHTHVDRHPPTCRKLSGRCLRSRDLHSWVYLHRVVRLDANRTKTKRHPTCTPSTAVSSPAPE